jgi:hypothetical protein
MGLHLLGHHPIFHFQKPVVASNGTVYVQTNHGGKTVLHAIRGDISKHK